MKLKDYLDQNFLNYKFLVTELSVSRQQVSNWVTGKVIPRKETMEKINKLTKGKVKYQDWFNG